MPGQIQLESTQNDPPETDRFIQRFRLLDRWRYLGPFNFLRRTRCHLLETKIKSNTTLMAEAGELSSPETKPLTPKPNE